MAQTLLQKNYLIFGAGRSGLSTASAIIKAGGRAFLSDDNPLEAREDIPEGVSLWCLDDGLPESIEAVILSPGVPLTHPKPHKIVDIAHAKNIPIISDIELFYLTYHSHPQVKFIAITGTNGKSTVTALTEYLLTKMGHQAFAGGNIGRAIFDLPSPAVLENKPIYYVLEISSYQADLCFNFAPDAVAFLNLTPDHLDRHGDIEGYFGAKMRLFNHLSEKGKAVIVDESDYGRRAIRQASPHLYTVTEYEKSAVAEAINENLFLRGDHNHQNACAAFGLLRILGIKAEDIFPYFKSFHGLPHRCEFIAKYDNISFINDSKATNAEATQKALLAYDNIFWLLGGVAKAEGIDPLMPFLKNVTHAFIYGEAKLRYADSLTQANHPFSVHETLSDALASAFAMARKNASEATLLLSPASASFDQFKNFEHRGDMFKSLVQKLFHFMDSQ